MVKRIIILSATALAVLFSGCYQTETWTTITGKGGIERKIDIQIPKTNKEQLKDRKEAFEKNGWKIKEKEKDDKYHLIAEKKFKNANDYQSPFDDTQIKLEKKDGKFIYTEVFDAKKSAGITDTNRTAWTGLYYTFHLTMPSKIEKSSAGKIDGRKATWEFDVNAVFDQGVFIMTAETGK